MGTLVPIRGSLSNGTPWEHMAFMPHPLSEDNPELTSSAWLGVAEARAALGALDATARRLPNPQLFRQSTLRLEAQSTAALEGTYEPLARVLAADEEESSDPSLREVINYVVVAETAFAWNEQGRPWSIASLANLQALLMRGTPSEREDSGRIRSIQVVIGRRPEASPRTPPIQAARFVPPPPSADLEARVRDLLTWMQTSPREHIDPVVAAAMGHYAFEALHPFHDGNGRLGRLLIVLQLHRIGVLSEPTLSVSPWFESRRSAYFDALMGVSTEGDWSTWVEFFAEGLADSARTTQERMVALADLQEALKERLQQSRLRSMKAPALIDFAVGNPTFTIRQAADGIGMAYQGAKKLIDALIDLDVLAPFGERAYNKRFHVPAVLDILLQRTEAAVAPEDSEIAPSG